MTDPIPVPEAPPPATSSTGLARHLAAGLACLFSIVSGVVFLVIERRDKFVRFWAMQSVLLGALAILAAVGVAIAAPVLGWLPLIGGVLSFFLKVAYLGFQVAWVVVYLVCVIKAFSSQEWEIPVLGKIARRQLAHLDATQPPGD